MASRPFITMKIIEKYKRENGWNNKTVLDLLVTYIANQKDDAALASFLAEAAGQPEDDDDLSEVPEAFRHLSADDVAERCISSADGNFGDTVRQLWESLGNSVEQGTAKPVGGDHTEPSSPGKVGSTEEPIVSSGEYGSDLVAVWPSLSEAARRCICNAAKRDRGRPGEYLVDWAKTYVASGTITLIAASTSHAEALARDRIGDLEGSMQYDPNEDYIFARKK